MRRMIKVAFDYDVLIIDIERTAYCSYHRLDVDHACIVVEILPRFASRDVSLPRFYRWLRVQDYIAC